jgi:hypothetical protein
VTAGPLQPPFPTELGLTDTIYEPIANSPTMARHACLSLSLTSSASKAR